MLQGEPSEGVHTVRGILVGFRIFNRWIPRIWRLAAIFRRKEIDVDVYGVLVVDRSPKLRAGALAQNRRKNKWVLVRYAVRIAAFLHDTVLGEVELKLRHLIGEPTCGAHRLPLTPGLVFLV
jgi:hypothetical protein